MNKADGLLGAGILSTLYSWVGPATDVLQLVAAILGIVATVCAIILYIKKIRHYDSINNKDDSD